MSWRARCPTCGSDLGVLPVATVIAPLTAPSFLRCDDCAVAYPCHDGIWRFVRPARAEAVQRFVTDYLVVRHGEQRGSTDPEWYRRLPATAVGDPQAEQWRMRGVTWRHLQPRLALAGDGPLRVLDLGAGMGWLSNRLHLAGHLPLSVDVSPDAVDGLAAARHYPATWPLLQAEFDALPLAAAQADVAIFNASFHYAVDAAATLAEACRLVRPGGLIVIVDTPVYRHDESGRQMLAERRADFVRRFGTASDSLPSIGFLTRTALDRLGAGTGIRWRISSPWYGWRWHLRPLRARLARRREPSRFLTVVGTNPGRAEA